MDGLRIPNRPKRDLGAVGPGLGATVTDPAPDATASCSRTDELRSDETVKTIIVVAQLDQQLYKKTLIAFKTLRNL